MRPRPPRTCQTALPAGHHVDRLQLKLVCVFGQKDPAGHSSCTALPASHSGMAGQDVALQAPPRLQMVGSTTAELLQKVPAGHSSARTPSETARPRPHHSPASHGSSTRAVAFRAGDHA